MKIKNKPPSIRAAMIGSGAVSWGVIITAWNINGGAWRLAFLSLLWLAVTVAIFGRNMRRVWMQEVEQ